MLLLMMQLQEADLANQAQRAAMNIQTAAQSTWQAGSKGASDALNRFVEGGGFDQLERFHEPAFAANCSMAFLKFAPNCFETSALFARNTGLPSPPSFPAMLILAV